MLTHHPRPSIAMNGGTTFHFLDASPEEALQQAREAAGGLDVRIGGGTATIRQFLAADLIDHLHVAIVPILLGVGNVCGTASRIWNSASTSRPSTSPTGVMHVIFNR